MRISMAKKKDNDKVLEPYDPYVVYSVVLADAVGNLARAWDTIRDFRDEPNRELTEREILHLRSALYIVKEIHEDISIVAAAYNFALKKKKDNKIVSFKTGS